MNNISWSHTVCSGYIGLDDRENIYYQGASRETTSVLMKDGRTGAGWTPEDALKEAMKKPVPEVRS